ncbi:MAG: cell division protein FtsL [Coriobacteriia bacterium]|nr:cell division protein FtsL [Coriobacteriia bacterium]
MGAAAHKVARATPARPPLRLVPGGNRHARTHAANAASIAFRVAVISLIVLTAAGVARVSLAARAAEATIDAWELRAEVKAERLMSRSLEADRSALAAPSRIEAVACQSLNMTRPAQVAYLQLPSSCDTSVEAAMTVAEGTAAPATAEQKGERGLLGTLMDLAAGEAQVLLVGDVGLGSLQ